VKWENRGIKPPNIAIVAEQIEEVQEAGWTHAQVLLGLEGPGAVAWIAEERGGHSGKRSRSGVGVVQGFVVARRIVDVLEIDLVAVRPSVRRRGIARALINDLLDHEIVSGLAEARLELASGNHEARLLYLGLRFVVVGRRTRYYPDGEDALLLSRLDFSS